MNRMVKLKKFMSNHINADFYVGTILALLFALAIIPGYLLLPESFGYENSIVENIQLFVLIISCIFCLKSKNIEYKKFFIFAFLILTILMIREVNCGRTIFFAVPGEVNSFYRWSEIKYGWLAHPLFGIYIASVAIYFLKNKLFISLWNIIKNYKSFMLCQT